MKKPKLTDARYMRIYQTDEDYIEKLMRRMSNITQKQDVIREAISLGLPLFARRMKQ